MEVNNAIATRSSAQFFSHSHVNAVAVKKGGPSKEALRRGGALQPHTINSSWQWYTLEVDLKKVGFRESWVGCCGACDGFKSPVPMGAGLQ